MNKITHLIPATEFILQFDSPHIYRTKHFFGVSQICSISQVIYNYAQFLKQPLQEWMFVGEVRLFENAVVINETSYKDVARYIVDLNHKAGFRLITQLKYKDGRIERDFLPNFSEIPTIEYLVTFKLELTPKALEQIYGSI